MLEDENTGWDVVAGYAEGCVEMISYLFRGRDEKYHRLLETLYRPRKRTLERAGCLESSCRKMCLLGRGPGVVPLILCLHGFLVILMNFGVTATRMLISVCKHEIKCR